MDGCASDEELAGFLEGSLDDQAARRMREHLDGCDDCRRLVAAAISIEPRERAPRKPAAVRPGDVIGRFGVDAVSPVGAQRIVCDAVEETTARAIALELFPVGDVGIRERLLEAARATARVRHPHVIEVFEAGIEEPFVFVARERLDGGDLRKWLWTEMRPWRAIVERFARAADGLAAAHAYGLAHGDFSPHEVLLGLDGRLRVGGFGVLAALAAEAQSPHAALHGALALNDVPSVAPAFRAPEQLRGAPADALADQFGLCASLYFALHRALPYPGDDAPALLASIEGNQLRPPPRSPVPRRVHAVLARGLAARASDRFPSMSALSAALTDALARRFW